MNYYEVLGVSKEASGEVIKKAYRGLSRKYHPDNVGEGEREKFEQVQEAYAVLGDEGKRREYDERLAAGVFGGRQSQEQKEFQKQENNYGDPTAFFGGACQNSFEKFFGFGAMGTEAKAKEAGRVNTDKLFEAFFRVK